MKRALSVVAWLLALAAFASIGFTHDHVWMTAVLFVLAIAAGAVRAYVQKRGDHPRDRDRPETPV